MSEALPALFLGLLQGLTEFLPVSSSGHLALAKSLFSIEDASLSYDILLHFATMLATLFFFGRDIVRLFLEWLAGFLSRKERGEGWNVGWAVIAGTLLTGAVALPLKPLVVRMGSMPWAVGAGLLLTSLLLWMATSDRGDERDPRPITPVKGLFIGVVQGVAVLPGVSRSGSTIFAGLRAGLGAEQAFRFSFLLSIPAVLGATLLEARGLLSVAAPGASLPPGWQAGMLVSFAAGYCSLVLLRRVAASGRWRPFAVYCALAGFLSIFLSIAGSA
ncbi:MAG: undecaprenyl-diphosphate phosphatase [Synergistaceae bacterium]|nr:undecaprenyl-diphosphate phosphatase [Synergistota bacterium]NLM72011.1 undecaprenyl-diphosphate phosphatase [Synergistaceae bacterium]